MISFITEVNDSSAGYVSKCGVQNGKCELQLLTYLLFDIQNEKQIAKRYQHMHSEFSDTLKMLGNFFRPGSEHVIVSGAERAKKPLHAPA